MNLSNASQSWCMPDERLASKSNRYYRRGNHIHWGAIVRAWM
jgi:hypothetical protein